MEPRRFDDIVRSLAAPRSRRGLLGGLGILLLGARSAAAQTSCPDGRPPNRRGECRCPAGTDACPGGGCVDKKRDPNNCGGCGRFCDGGRVCVKGECRCPAGTESCSGDCLSQEDFASDPFNCGGCDNFCPDGACSNGSCGTPACDGRACGDADGCGGTCFGECATCQECNGVACVNSTGPRCGGDSSTNRCCNGQCGACIPNNFVCQVGSGNCNNDCSLCCSNNFIEDPNGGFLFCA